MSDVSIHSPLEKIIEGQLDERIKSLEELLDGDVISFVGSLLFGCEDVFRDEVERCSGGTSTFASRTSVRTLP